MKRTRGIVNTGHVTGGQSIVNVDGETVTINGKTVSEGAGGRVIDRVEGDFVRGRVVDRVEGDLVIGRIGGRVIDGDKVSDQDVVRGRIIYGDKNDD